MIQATTVLALTVGLSLARPRLAGVRMGPPTAAVAGALLTLGLGLLTAREALEVLVFLTPPLLTIVGLMAVTVLAEEAGLFRILARRLARAGDGRPRLLFALLFFTGTLTGAVFTNDAAVLIYTPLVYGLVEEVGDGWERAQKIPFYFAVLYVANLVGPLSISNPINLIVAEWFGIGFLEYARWMVLPALVSILVTYAGLRLYFGRDLVRPYTVPVHHRAPPADRRFLGATVGVLLLILAGFFGQGWTGVPTVGVAVAGALLLAAAFRVLHPGASLRRMGRRIGWDVVIFVVGIFLVAAGFHRSGGTAFLEEWILAAGAWGTDAARVTVAFLAGGASAVLNNHPVAQIMAFTVDDLPVGGAEQKVLALSALIGGDLGPKMLPIGSLAALMWFRMLRDRGVEISYREYVRLGVPVTLSAILLSVLTLVLEARLG